MNQNELKFMPEALATRYEDRDVKLDHMTS